MGNVNTFVKQSPDMEKRYEIMDKLFWKSQLRVASYNIQHGVGMDNKLDYKRIASVLENFNPDVIAVQEVDSMTHRTNNTYSLGEIANHMSYYASYAPAISFDGGKYSIIQTLASQL